MGRSTGNRTAAIIAASAVVHLLLLSALAIEATRSGPSQTVEQPVIQVTLEPPVPPAERKPLAKPRKAASAPAPRTPAPAPQTAQTAAPSAPRIDAGEAAAMGDVVRALRGSVGCSNPDAVGLTPAERETCRRRFHAGLEEAKPLSGLTEEKRNRFDRAVRCRQLYQDAQVPNRLAPSSGPIPGLGYFPRLRDCPPSDQ